ncbi:uncharacterized protein MJAP1_002063 [Malassezia japonica]|uniref:Uncharacterized protein n=1 Tax=Malassezia japonica TaxID=223818 RepID=A0AAF0F224_9BASI|nr:uncharacterized protein MJAP1_002063 [Malassezia japonica]WFD39092.1 hypothetical protein MJAP1_002063 [Malassezia japonica]
MSKPAVPTPAEKRSLVDEVLGAFRHVPPSKTLDHVGRFLSTWSGTDKSLMTVQYSSKAVVGVLLFLQGVRARLNLSTVGKTPSGVAPLLKLADLIGDARILYRIWGLLPMIQWLITIERTPPPTKLLLQIERIQAWSMVAYCPMEAIAYLGYHKVLNVSTDAQNWLWKHALRLWLLYIVLQFVHLIEDNRLLRLRTKALERSRGHPQPRVVKGSTEPSAPLSEDQQVTRRMWDEIRERKTSTGRCRAA